MMAPHELRQSAQQVEVDLGGTATLSVKPESQMLDGATTPDQGLVELVPAESISPERKQDATNQLLWDRVMCKEMEIPDGYEHVAVLMVKWADQIDQLKTAAEVKELERLFRVQFNYETEVVELGVHCHAQLQLDRAIIDFIMRYDRPTNLLVLYYTGHGSFDGGSHKLVLHPNDVEDAFETEHPARCVWDKVETRLMEEVQADVLAILDTCYAASVHKSGRGEDPRTYELLSATGPDRSTSAPGPTSFTSVMIESLKELLEQEKGKPFSTLHLVDKITYHKDRRKTPPYLAHRLRRYDRRINLAPIKPASKEQGITTPREPPQSYLTLRFGLRQESINEKELERLARSLSKAVKNQKTSVDVQRIDYLQLRKRAKIGWRGYRNVIRAKGILTGAIKNKNLGRLPLPSAENVNRRLKRKRTHEESSEEVHSHNPPTPTSALDQEDGAT